MGAYGAALTALSNHRAIQGVSTAFVNLENPEMGTDFSQKEIRCSGCENRRAVLKLTFGNKNRFYTGNRCAWYFSKNTKIS